MVISVSQGDCGCAGAGRPGLRRQSPSAPGDVPYGERFDLKVGESARVGDDSVGVTFEAVRSDSRCPIDAICLHSGDAVVALRFTVGGKTLAKDMLTEQNTTEVVLIVTWSVWSRCSRIRGRTGPRCQPTTWRSCGWTAASGRLPTAARAMPAATATFRESASGSMGILTRSEASVWLAWVRPGPSAPTSSASRPGTPRATASSSALAPPGGVSAHTSMPSATRCPDHVRPRGRDRVRHRQRRPARDANGLPIQRVPGPRAQQHAVHAQGPRRAEQAPDVVRVADAFEHEQPTCVRCHVAPRDRGASLPTARQPAVHVEADESLHPRGGDDEHLEGPRASAEHVVQCLVRRLGDQDRARAIARLGQQPPNDQTPLGQEHAVTLTEFGVADIAKRREPAGRLERQERIIASRADSKPRTEAHAAPDARRTEHRSTRSTRSTDT